MIVYKIISFNDFLAMEPYWDKLLQKSCHDLVFLTFDVIRMEWEHIGWELDDGKRLHPFLLVVKDQNEMLAIFPFVKERRKLFGYPINCIRPLNHIHLDRADFIIVKKDAEVINAVVDYLVRVEKQWTLLLLKNVSENSCITKWLEKGTKIGRLGVLPGYRSPYVKVDTSWADYYKGLSKNVRSSINNKSNKLERDGVQVNARMYQTNEELGPALEVVFSIDSKSWKADEGTALSSTEKSRKYWHSLTRTLAAEKRVNIWILWFNEKPAAYEYHVIYGSKVYSLKWSYDKDYQTYSPGLLLRHASMKHYWDRDITEIDLLGNADSFKMKWARDIRYHNNIYYFNSTLYSSIIYYLFFGLRSIFQYEKPFERNSKLAMYD